ncbi:MAG: BlaI/MecI/CopY family transcriptional regulator [Bacteroidales bacterium]
MSTKIPKPTESELQILQVLWQFGPSTVRFVNGQLNSDKTVGYTTTLKLMQIMFEKKLVSRNESEKTHVYEAAINEKEAQDQLLDRFLETAFKGSAMKMVMHALGNRKASKQEIDELRKLLDKMDNEEKL